MPESSLQVTQDSYDRVASVYGEHIADELAGKPFDRALLDCLVETVGLQGMICDLGCGPGHVARYLHDQGAQVCGMDLSPGMVAEAKRRNPEIAFSQGNMLELPVPDASWNAIVAWYSLIHIPQDQQPTAIREMWRVLRPNGILFLAFHSGDKTVHLEEWWEQSVSLDFRFLDPTQIIAMLRDCGFTIEMSLERAPHEGVEHASQRAYIWARKQG